jgi:hypothetical protein
MSQRHEKSVLFLCTGNYYRSRFAESFRGSASWLGRTRTSHGRDLGPKSAPERFWINPMNAGT